MQLLQKVQQLPLTAKSIMTRARSVCRQEPGRPVACSPLMKPAAHLLYFVIKNNPFSDGNKRSGAFLFLLYLRQEGMRLTLNEQGLTAMTLLIAESDPKAKDLMVRLVMNLIAEDVPDNQAPTE